MVLDEHIAWNDHIHAIEQKLAKEIRLLYRARQFLDEESLKTIYFSYIHSYQVSKISNMAFEKPTHKYPTQFSETNFKYKKYSLTSTKQSIFVRRPKIWNEFLTKEEIEIKSHSIFLKKIKTKLLESGNERKYF